MQLDKAKILATYEQLLAKLEHKFAEIQARNQSQMKCGRGCHACCVPNLTVFGVPGFPRVCLYRLNPNIAWDKKKAR